jgi:hypothetical protein
MTMGGGRHVSGDERAVREIPIMWTNGIGGWMVRVVIDLGEGARVRYAWEDGREVQPGDLNRVAKALLQADGEGQIR